MKRLILAVMAITLMAAPMANAQKVNKAAIVAKLDKADADSKDAKKGSKAAVSGSIQTRSYEVEGQKRYATDIVADEVQFLSTRSGDGEFDAEDTAPAVKAAPVSTLEPVDEDLPF